jgi:hypothetical protein
MAVTSYLYASFPQKAMRAEIDFADDTIRVALCTSSYTPDQDNHDYFDDITNEVVGTGYVADGEALASKTDNVASDVTTLDAADVTWSSSSITARYGIIYKDTGTASTSPLIGYIDFGEDKSSSDGDFTLTWNASGIITFTVPSA